MITVFIFVESPSESPFFSIFIQHFYLEIVFGKLFIVLNIRKILIF